MQVVNDAPETKAWGKPPTNSGQEGKQQQDVRKIEKQPEVGSRGDHMRKKKKPGNKRREPRADGDKSRKEKENTDTNKAKSDRKDVSSEKQAGESERPRIDLEPPKKPVWKKDVTATKVWSVVLLVNLCDINCVLVITSGVINYFYHL